MATPRMLLGRVVLYALLTETIMIALAIGLRVAGAGEQAVTVMALCGSFALPLVFATLLGRSLSSRFVLHGVLIGFVAMLTYLALVEAARRWGPPQPPQPFAYTIAHFLKVLGGALGGVVARRAAAAQQHATLPL